MIKLDSRRRMILLLLLEAQEYISVKSIAAILKISPRSVRDSMTLIEEWLLERRITLEKKPGSGYRMIADAAKRKILLNEMRGEKNFKIFFTPADRKNYIKFLLLTSYGSPLVVKQLVVLLGASRATVFNELPEVDQWLSAYQIKLVKRPNYGCWIEGAPADVRKAVISFILDNLPFPVLVSLAGYHHFLEQEKVQKQDALQQAIIDYIHKLNLPVFRSYIQRIESDLIVRFTDISRIELLLYLALVVNHSGQLHSDGLSLAEPINEGAAQRETNVAQTIITEIEKQFRLTIPHTDVESLADQIRKAEQIVPEANFLDPRQKLLGFSPRILSFVNAMVEHAALRLHPSLQIDQQLALALAEQIGVFLKYLELDIPIKNQLLDGIKADYGHIWEVAKECSQIMAQSIEQSVSEEETGFIAMCLIAAMEKLHLESKGRRVLVVCNAGLTTSWLLASRIKAEFPQIVIEGIISINELYSGERKKNVDLIVSTTPLQNVAVPVVVVSPLLKDSEKETLRIVLDFPAKSVRSNTVRQRQDKTNPALSDILTMESIALKVQANDWTEVVDQGGLLLLKTGAIEHGFIQAIKELIHDYGPYMVVWPGIALLHASPSSGILHLCASLITLKEPVRFGHADNDPVDIAFVLGAVDNHSHIGLLKDLSRLARDASAMKRLRSTASKATAMKIIQEFSIH